MRKEICEQIAVPVMAVPEVLSVIKIHIGDMTAEISAGVSEQTITSVIRAIRNA